MSSTAGSRPKDLNCIRTAAQAYIAVREGVRLTRVYMTDAPPFDGQVEFEQPLQAYQATRQWLAAVAAARFSAGHLTSPSLASLRSDPQYAEIVNVLATALGEGHADVEARLEAEADEISKVVCSDEGWATTWWLSRELCAGKMLLVNDVRAIVDEEREPIFAEGERSAVEALLGRYGLTAESLEIVPDVQERSIELGVEEKSPDCVAKALARADGRPLILIRSEISASNRRRVRDRLLLGQVPQQCIDALRSRSRFLEHTVLHELGHAVRGFTQAQEDECDEWAFREMGILG